MDRFILIAPTETPLARMNAAVSWLESEGGGTIVTESKRNMTDSFGTRTDGEFSRLESSLSAIGINLTWKRRGLPRSGNVVAAFTTAELIADLDAMDGIDRLLVLGWHPSDYSKWMERVQPQHVVLRK